MKRLIAWTLMPIRGLLGIMAVVLAWQGEWWGCQLFAVGAKTTQAIDGALTGNYMAKEHRLFDDITNALLTVPCSLLLLSRKSIPDLAYDLKGEDAKTKGWIIRDNFNAPWAVAYGLIEAAQLGLQIGRSKTGNPWFARLQSAFYHFNDAAILVNMADRMAPLEEDKRK